MTAAGAAAAAAGATAATAELQGKEANREASDRIVDGVAASRDEGGLSGGESRGGNAAADAAGGQHDLGVATGFTGESSCYLKERHQDEIAFARRKFLECQYPRHVGKQYMRARHLEIIIFDGVCLLRAKGGACRLLACQVSSLFCNAEILFVAHPGAPGLLQRPQNQSPGEAISSFLAAQRAGGNISPQVLDLYFNEASYRNPEIF